MDVGGKEVDDRRAGRGDAAGGDGALKDGRAFHRAQRRGDIRAVELLLVDAFADMAERFHARLGQ